ncbi:translation initiation factor IF-2-like [Cotesia glomerata]|uniref:Uncharacterized protein n=1 Tax=Cotesia glomerata TaxID=32391 RepID=A0AAV7IM06_COTGL|nr:translation initiation factor IF-2-like [Cotesia glomerata]KAH0554172.1 hypothetical protein KQX54_008192 [Cotesia glomerata]
MQKPNKRTNYKNLPALLDEPSLKKIKNASKNQNDDLRKTQAENIRAAIVNINQIVSASQVNNQVTIKNKKSLKKTKINKDQVCSPFQNKKPSKTNKKKSPKKTQTKTDTKENSLVLRTENDHSDNEFMTEKIISKVNKTNGDNDNNNNIKTMAKEALEAIEKVIVFSSKIITTPKERSVLDLIKTRIRDIGEANEKN